MSSCIAADASLSPAKPAWRAVYALALGVFGLIVAEFLPASLLTPMASSLGVSEGWDGRTGGHRDGAGGVSYRPAGSPPPPATSIAAGC